MRVNIKLIKSEQNIKIEQTFYFNFVRSIRRVQNSLLGRLVEYERNTLYLNYIDDSNKNLGGVIKAKTSEFNFSMLRLFNYNQFGYFTDDRIVFGKYINKY